MPVGVVTLLQDRYIRRVRVIEASFVGGDGDLIIQALGCRSFTLQTTGIFGGGNLTIARSNDGIGFSNLQPSISHITPSFSALPFASIGWLFYRVRILTGSSLQNVQLFICIDE